MKTNLFSRFRNLFRKAEPDYEYDDDYAFEEANDEGYSEVAVEDAVGVEDTVEDAEAATAQSGPSSRLPHGAQIWDAQPDGDGVHVPLSPIIAGMPLELQGRVLYEIGDLCVYLPLDTILPQLSRGVVSLSFGELRNAAPKLFSTDRDQDDTTVNVPLSAVLPHISPELLARRHGPLQMDIPDDIVSPFADKGKGLAIGSVRPVAAQTRPGTRAGSAPPPPAPAQHSRPESGPAQPIPMPVRAPQPGPGSSTPPATPVAPQRPVPPVPPRPSVGHAMPHPLGVSKPAPGIGASPTPPPRPVRPSVPWSSVADKGTTIPGKPGAPKLPTPTPEVPAQAAPATPTLARQPLMVALSAIADAWPDSLKQEVIQLNLAEAKLAIPYDVVEAGLKRGRLKFAWRKLKSWVYPEVTAAVSVHDGAELELPLRVVAPLFINQKKEQPQKAAKVAVDKDIPNLFFGLPQPDTAGLAVDHSVSRPMDTNYYVWDDQSDVVPDDARNSATHYARTAGTEFVTRYATPNEVASRAAALDGVEGAIISLPDGLMVASQLPAGVNGDTLAAFLPHIFGKVTQCTQELRMGELNNLNFTVGNVPWKIFRVNALYFAAFGAKGRPMPTAKLAALAAELDHKAKV